MSNDVQIETNAVSYLLPNFFGGQSLWRHSDVNGRCSEFGVRLCLLGHVCKGKALEE